MKIVEGFRMRPLGKEFIVVGEGIKLVDFNKIISLNETAAYLWKNIEGREFDAPLLASLLEEQYEVDHETALKDSEKIIEDWVAAGIVEK